MTRVRRPGGTDSARLVPPERGSELALDELRLEPGSSVDLTDPLHDTLLFVHAGDATLCGEPLAGRGAGLLRAGQPGALDAGSAAVRCVRATVGAATDLHAPMGGDERLVALEQVESGRATGARSFQLLYGPHNGSTRATLFVGYIPPGRAPWHYHLYDEIVWILDGVGRLHLGDEVEELAAGCAFRLRPREAHIVENVSPDRELAVLGIFTPAGSPSAAYLTAETAETYAFTG